MMSDAETFGLGNKKRKLKPGESGDEFSDYSFEPDGPNDAVEKQPQSFNEMAPAPTSQTKPIGTPQQSAPATSTSADTPTKPAAAMNTDGYAAPAVTTARTGAPAGYDATKWGNASHQTPKYAVSGIVADAISKGAKDVTPELVARISAAYPGTTMVDSETVNIPGVGKIRVINEGELRWDDLANASPSSGSVDPIAELVASQSVGTPPTGQSQAVGTAAQLSLMDGIDADPATAAFRRSLTRDTARQREQLAEQAAQDGTAGSGGTEGRVRQLEEGRDEAIAGFAGNRAADVQKLQIAQDQFLKGLGFNYAQLDQQQKQFLQNIGQNKDQFLASLGLSYAQLSAQQRAQLDSLGLAYDQLEYQQNRDATLAALGGS